MSELSFERDIAAIARRASYPATPAMRERVLAAIAAPRAQGMRPLRAQMALAVALAAIVVAGIAAALAVPSSRSAVADFFGVEGSQIEPAPTATVLAAPTDIVASAEAVPVGGIEAVLGFRPLLAEGREARGAYIVRYGAQAAGIVRYDEFDLWEAQLVSEAYFGKGAPSGVTVTDTFVGGVPARWVSGGRHFVGYVDALGKQVASSERTVDANTLIWNDGEIFLRMETALPLDEARRIAEGLR